MRELQKDRLRVCVLCGGQGTRLWPLSRTDKPKQFLELSPSGRTLLEETLIRASVLTNEPVCLVCNEKQLFLVEESIKKAKSSCHVIVEPASRDTAAAILSSIIVLSENGKRNVNVLVLPSDLMMNDDLSAKIRVATTLASKGYYVTFGVKPNRLETGYGYLKAGKALEKGVFLVDQFTEKPNLEKAQQFVSEGNYYWNSGIFLINSKKFLEDMKTIKKTLYQNVLKAFPHENKLFATSIVRLDKTAYMEVESISIDLSLMEQSPSIVMIPLEGQWSDMGTWESIYLEGQKDHNGNVVKGDVVTLRTKGSYLYSSSRLLTTVGIDNLLIIDTRDALLVANRQDTQGVKELVQILKLQSRSEITRSSQVKRSWGEFQVLMESERFQVKRLAVLPGKSLSLQIHHHRAEHWVIVKGFAEIIKNKKKFFLNENESIYIPVGCLHQLANPGKITLEVIEVQTGSYLQEDDIIRFSS